MHNPTFHCTPQSLARISATRSFRRTRDLNAATLAFLASIADPDNGHLPSDLSQRRNPFYCGSRVTKRQAATVMRRYTYRPTTAPAVTPTARDAGLTILLALHV